MTIDQYFSKVLKVSPQVAEELTTSFRRCSGEDNVFSKLLYDNDQLVRKTITTLNISGTDGAAVAKGLHEAIWEQEASVLKYLEDLPGVSQFERAAALAVQLAGVKNGFFLKRERAVKILESRPPQNLMSFLKVANVEELLEKYDVIEVFSALRFMETDEWMHETFSKAYSYFDADDFEERAIEVRVLGDVWHEVAKKFVEKKHHNVSHLKEFGVIFLNSIAEDVRGKFLRDFALLLHYLHEIEFYAKMFRAHVGQEDFVAIFNSLLRGDLPEAKVRQSGEWLIIQRYLFKLNPEDPRLYVPHVNPESIHWRNAELDLVRFGKEHPGLGLEVWEDTDWVANFYEDVGLVSFDMEDVAMSSVDGKIYSYHQQEALWTKLGAICAGGYERLEEQLLQNFTKGVLNL